MIHQYVLEIRDRNDESFSNTSLASKVLLTSTLVYETENSTELQSMFIHGERMALLDLYHQLGRVLNVSEDDTKQLRLDLSVE